MGLAFISQLAFASGPSVVGQHFRGLLVADQFGTMWKLLLLLFVAGVILMWFTTAASTMHEGDGPEFFTLLLSATLGMSLMASTSNLLMLFHRRRNGVAAELRAGGVPQDASRRC